jgi:two-component system sensor histidine kinase UhpB
MRPGPNRKTADRPVVHARHLPRSLHGQLVLIPTAILLLGLLGTIGVVLLDARDRIAAEITSGMQLGHDLVTTTLRNVANADSPAAAFDQLAQDLPRVRHVQFELIRADGTAFHRSKVQTGATIPRPRPWLAQLLAPPPAEQVFPIVVHGKTIGKLLLRSNSADEIAEIVGEVEMFSGVLVGLCLLIVGGLLLTVRRSLRPVQLLADGFDRLERGDHRPIASIPVTEFQRVGHQFNLLAQSLHRVTSDNHFLIDKLLSMQDQERKELAAELHDEFGPVLFGIRAEAACIMRSTPCETDPYARAQSIARLTDGIQKVNYRMLDRLRPLVLEQMGLSQAVRQLVASWQSRYRDITWSLNIPLNFDDPDEASSLTLYRVVQESATNAVRHAQASAIDIRLDRQPTDAARDAATARRARELFLSVRDDGRGLAENFRCGFGLLGMTERVRQLGGTLVIRNAQPGVTLEVTIPEEGQRATVESGHADLAD